MVNLRISTGCAAGASVAQAARTALGQIAARHGSSPVDAALCFLTPAAAPEAAAGLAAVTQELAPAALLGLRASSLCDHQREIDAGIGVAVLAFSGVEAELHRFPDLRGEEARAGYELAASLAGGERDGDLAFLGFDALAFAVDPFLAAIGEKSPKLLTLGLGESDPLSRDPSVWGGCEPVEQGACALVVRLPRPARFRFASSFTMGASCAQITRSEANWLFEIDGEPALTRFREAAGGRLGRDLDRAREFLMIALLPEAGGPAAPPSVLEVIGIDSRRGALVLSEPVSQGASFGFALRDTAGARSVLETSLEALREPAPATLLYLGDGSRGRALFDLEGLEPGYLGRAFPDTPVAGAFGAMMVGPGESGPRRVGHSALAVAFPGE